MFAQTAAKSSSRSNIGMSNNNDLGIMAVNRNSSNYLRLQMERHSLGNNAIGAKTHSKSIFMMAANENTMTHLQQTQPQKYKKKKENSNQP